MRTPRASAAVPLALALALASAGCGGGDSKTATTSTGSGGPTKVIQGKPGEATTIEFSKTALEEAAVRTSVEDVLASGRAGDACGKEATDRYIGAAYGDRRACLAAQRPGSAARSVSVPRIEIAGASAKAVAVPHGGPSDGQTITVSLVSQGGVWKVDAVSSSAPVGP